MVLGEISDGLCYITPMEYWHTGYTRTRMSCSLRPQHTPSLHACGLWTKLVIYHSLMQVKDSVVFFYSSHWIKIYF